MATNMLFFFIMMNVSNQYVSLLDLDIPQPIPFCFSISLYIVYFSTLFY